MSAFDGENDADRVNEPWLGLIKPSFKFPCSVTMLGVFVGCEKDGLGASRSVDAFRLGPCERQHTLKNTVVTRLWNAVLNRVFPSAKAKVTQMLCKVHCWPFALQ